ncbi:hypothetical protein [Lentiprolixibacter aurantiacus]|uniref:Lipocalin-like domain-containing protein n=1 Tax=Lentiprolixibacter aurantiacus TaxID=2993939 RepID=A0AAE3MM24_9FLAO|nr:hypothetical protein [Lentiprolixibacter aurantiacus]MCX2719944.1 hypothetical protein [Lentiprolixibacter aurantiacus]
MKTLSKILIAPLFLFAFLLLSCSSDDEDAKVNEGPSYAISDLAGTWIATEIRFSYCGSGTVEPSSVDIIAEGATATMVVQTTGRFTLTITFPDDVDDEIITGKMYFENGEFFAIQFDDDPPDDPTYFGDTLSGNTFTLNGGPETAEFDFDDDGNEECASVYLKFVRD